MRTDEAREMLSTVIRVEGEWIVIELHGEVDVSTVERVGALLEGITASGEWRVVLDLERVTFIDSAGIGLVLQWQDRLRQLGGDLALRSSSAEPIRSDVRGRSANVIAVLTDAGFHSHIPDGATTALD